MFMKPITSEKIFPFHVVKNYPSVRKATQKSLDLNDFHLILMSM